MTSVLLSTTSLPRYTLEAACEWSAAQLSSRGVGGPAGRHAPPPLLTHDAWQLWDYLVSGHCTLSPHLPLHRAAAELLQGEQGTSRSESSAGMWQKWFWVGRNCCRLSRGCMEGEGIKRYL